MGEGRPASSIASRLAPRLPPRQRSRPSRCGRVRPRRVSLDVGLSLSRGLFIQNLHTLVYGFITLLYTESLGATRYSSVRGTAVPSRREGGAPEAFPLYMYPFLLLRRLVFRVSRYKFFKMITAFIANMTRASKPLSIEGVQVWRAQRIFCAHIEIYRYREARCRWSQRGFEL